MAKAPVETAATLPQPTPGGEVLTLEQWAEEASRNERRAEMLNAFVSVERAASRFTATRTAWAAAYAAFASAPA